MTLFGNRVVTDTVKMNSYWISVGSYCHITTVHTKRRDLHLDRMLGEYKGRDWVVCLQAEECQRLAANHLKLERCGSDSPSQPSA